MKVLNRPVKITVCCDGFVSIIREGTEGKKDRRLGAGLPCHSAWTMQEALGLIQRVCYLKPCFHGGKTGMLIEPKAPNWPLHGDAGDNIQLIEELAQIFQNSEEGYK